jgi:hypothetical protein
MLDLTNTYLHEAIPMLLKLAVYSIALCSCSEYFSR